MIYLTLINTIVNKCIILYKKACRKLYFRISFLPLNFYNTKVVKKSDMCKYI